MAILDATEQDFQQRVIDRSREVPVVVDFWAAWCGPCRQLTPVLESAASKREGDVELVKVDTAANQGLPRALGIRGIRAVKAFRDGRVVDEFVGAQPPANVERFFDGLVPSEADRLAAAGDEASLRRAVELEPRRADVAVPLARMLFARGERKEALRLLDPIAGSFQADGLRARARLEDTGAELGPVAPAVTDAFAALDAGERERAIDLLLEAMPSADGRK